MPELNLRLVVLVLLAMLAAARPAAAAPPESRNTASSEARAAEFPRPAALRPQVEFWKKVFGVYAEHQILIHDTEHLGRVYSVLDYRELVAAGENPIVVEQRERAGIASEKERIRALLLDLDARNGNDGGLSKEERKIWNLLAKDKNPRKFAEAADPTRIRAQTGLKERFGEGVRVSRRYLGEMEEIFRQEGLPTKLTRLPLVESCFDVEAYSKVGAAGIWQFMPATGRRYMSIGGVLDERRDPLRATRGAARHLKENYEVLGTWPLAITAYNHGRAGMSRAVRETATTDIARITRTYRGPLFGFASRNFYAEFLAALEVEAAYRDYFGELRFDPPFTGDEVLLRHALSGKAAASCADVSPAELAALNPAVEDTVFAGRANIPRGYILRVPAGSARAFEERLGAIPAEARVVASPARRKRTTPPRRAGTSKAKASGSQKSRAEAKGKRTGGGRATSAEAYRTHRVGRGQTLSHIARRYRVSVQRLITANNLRDTVIKPGQVLRIPAG
jgi:membrane-bound lytic murein transglycosylase D